MKIHLKDLLVQHPPLHKALLLSRPHMAFVSRLKTILVVFSSSATSKKLVGQVNHGGNCVVDHWTTFDTAIIGALYYPRKRVN